jgi:hypothetical protein
MPRTNIHRDALATLGDLNDIKEALEANRMATWLIDDVTTLSDHDADQAFGFQMGLRQGLDAEFNAGFQFVGLTPESLLDANTVRRYKYGQALAEYIIHRDLEETPAGDEINCAAPVVDEAPRIKVEATGSADYDSLSETTIPDDYLTVTITLEGRDPIQVRGVPVNTLVATDLCRRAPEKGLYFAAARLVELSRLDDGRIGRDADRVAEIMASSPAAEIQPLADRLVQELRSYSLVIAQNRKDLAALLEVRPDLAGMTSDRAMTLAYGAPALEALKLLGELTFSFREVKSADSYGDSSITEVTIRHGDCAAVINVTAGIHQPGIWQTGWRLLRNARDGNKPSLTLLYSDSEIRVLAASGIVPPN